MIRKACALGGPPRILLVLALAAGLSACTLGPDFASPPPPATAGYLPPEDLADRRDVIIGRISGDWWRLFQASELDRMVALALAGNPSLDSAKATLTQTRDLLRASAGALSPQVSADAGFNRQRVNLEAYGLSGASPVFNLYSLGPTVSYALDLFGGTHRLLEQGAARVEAAGYQLDGAYLTLTGAVVDQALNIAVARAQIQAVETILAEDEETLELVRRAHSLGAATEVDLVHGESQLAADRTLLPPLTQQLAEARHALARLLGQSPADYQPPDFDLASFTLPDPLPLSLPAELVHQRPDILAAEAELHAASAAIGIAAANQYPHLTLSATLTQAAFYPAQLWRDAASGGTAGLGLAAPLLDGGTLAAERRAAEAAYQGSLANYRLVVVQSFAQVADLLQALAHDTDQLAAEDKALAVAERALTLSRLSTMAGNAGILPVLDAERQSEQARLGRIRAQSQRQRHTAQLLLAMGGGWWNWPAAAGKIAP